MKGGDYIDRLKKRCEELDAGKKLAQKAQLRLTRKLEHVVAFVLELAEEGCSYGDDCPAFGSRHGTCLACRARNAIERLDTIGADG